MLIKTIFNDRLVEYELEFAKDVEGCFIYTARYEDTDELLSEREVYALELQEAQTIDEQWMENQICAAEYMYGDR